MRPVLSHRRFTARTAACVAVVAAGLWAALAPTSRPAAAEPAAPGVVGPEYVPADAAVFVYLDAAQLWGGSVGKEIRAADPKMVDILVTKSKSLFGVSPDQLRSATMFWPRLRNPAESEAFGLVLAFNAAYDPEQLRAGLKDVFHAPARLVLHTPSDRVAVLVVGLDEGYTRPRPAAVTGPLTPTIREAASGKHLLVAGVTPAHLPDEIRGDDPPPDVRPFLPLLRAESLTAVVDLDKQLAVEVRAKTSTPAQAADAEKVFGLIRTLALDGMTRIAKELGPAAAADPAQQGFLTLFSAVLDGVKGATFTTTGTETRARVAVPTDLPFGRAFVEAAAKVREAADRATSANNLKQIGLAMHNYEATYQTFPPAAVVDKAGKPLLSWRVLILPFVEQNTLYQQFKLDEPWDSPNNKKLLDKMPPVYRVPGDTRAKPNETRYRALVGNGAAFDSLKGPKFADFTDGLSNTILVATAADPVPWTKPDELAFDPDQDMTKLLGFVDGRVSNTLFADGHVSALSKSISRKTLNAMITRAGGEVVGDDN